MSTTFIDQWETLKQFFPTGWESKAFELGAIKRRRKIDSPETLLRVLLIHLATGKSLRATAAYAYEAGLCDINDVALLHRFRAAEDWFRWFSQGLFASLQASVPDGLESSPFRIRLVDGTMVSEPGSTGSNWRLHFSYQLISGICDSCLVTDCHTGESFRHFSIAENDLLIADNYYCTRNNVAYVVDHGGDVLVRYRSPKISLHTETGKRFPLLDRLRALKSGDVGDWNVRFAHPTRKGEWVTGRLLAIRKSEQAAAEERASILAEARKKHRQVRPETLEQADYVQVFTTVTRHYYDGQTLLQLYRSRWQVELVFKRMKGLLALGHLPKQDETSCFVWFYGKLILALLAELLHRYAETFSPWGYPIGGGGSGRDGGGAQSLA